MKPRISFLLFLLASALSTLLGVFVSCELGLSTVDNTNQQMASAIDSAYSASLDKINGVVISGMKQNDFDEWWSSAKTAYDDKNGNVLSALYSQSCGNGFILRYEGGDYPISICEASASEADPRLSTHNLYSATKEGWSALNENCVFIGKSLAEKVFSKIIQTSTGFDYEAALGLKLSLSPDGNTWEEVSVGGVYFDSSSVAMDIPGRFFLDSFGDTFFVSSDFVQKHSFENAVATLSSKNGSCLTHLELVREQAKESGGSLSFLPKSNPGKTPINLQALFDSICAFNKNRESWWRIVVFSLILLVLLLVNPFCALIVTPTIQDSEIQKMLVCLLVAWPFLLTGLFLTIFKKIVVHISSSFFVSFLTPMGTMFSVLFAAIAMLGALLAIQFSGNFKYRRFQSVFESQEPTAIALERIKI